jgi:spermidine synthase
MFKKLKLFFCLLSVANIWAAQEITAPTILYSKKSPFGLIEVVKYPGLDDLNICENKDYSQTHSIIRQDDPTYMGASYAQLSTASFCVVEKLNNVLLLGLGGGEFLSYFVKYFPDANVDIVEINPVMIDIVKNFRKIKTDEKKVNFICADAFKYVDNMQEFYDLIFCDIYFFTPSIASMYLNVFEKAKSKLKEGGAFIFNAVPPEIPRVLMQNLFDKFDNVVALYSESGNIVFVCYQGIVKTKEALQNIAAQLQARYSFRYSLSTITNSIELITPENKNEWLEKFPAL